MNTPPYSETAEQAVLGAMMLGGATEVLDVVREEDFFLHRHRLIFRAIVKSPAKDSISVMEALRETEQLEEAGGFSYVARLCDDVPGAANARHYAAIVRREAQFRAVVAAGSELVSLGYQHGTATADEVIGKAEALLNEARESGLRSNNQAEGFSTLIPQVENEMEDARDGEPMRGIGSGLIDLDRLTNGFHESDLVIAAGRPGMGKTFLGMNIAEHVAMREGRPVLFFSLEMSKKELVRRTIANACGIELDTLRTGKLSEDQWGIYSEKSGMLRKAPLHIDDTPALSPMELRSRAKRHRDRHGLALIVVDYLQLMRVPGAENKYLEISEISGSLKALAKELRVPVIALAQLNRKVDDRANQRPRMSDIRDSGAVEQDADLMLFLYRDEVYDVNSNARGTIEIIIGKQRNGPTDVVRASFNGPLCRISNLAPNWAPRAAEEKPRRGFERMREPPRHYQDDAA